MNKPQVRSFTLVELLVVLAIIGILSAIVVPLIPSLLRSNQVDTNVQTLSGVLEQAREAAISGSTYVWVAFTDPSSTAPANGIWAVTIKSLDGTEAPSSTYLSPWVVPSNALTVPSSTYPNFQLLSKIQNLPGVKIFDSASQPTSYSTLVAKSTAAGIATATVTTLYEPSGMKWTITTLQNTSLSATPWCTHAIEFTPDGEAHVPTWSSNIQFGLMPSIGPTTNSALFNVSRLTGKVTVFRL